MKTNFYLLALLVFLSACTKDKIKEQIPFKERMIYQDDLDDETGWIPTPEASFYTPGPNCFHIEEGLLKLRFDLGLSNCGCAWIGAKKQIEDLNLPEDKIGLRVTLNRGYFQELTRYEQVTSYLQSGTRVIESTLRMTTPRFLMTIPNSMSGMINEDSVMNYNASKLKGTTFELIYNDGERLFYIDGIKQAANKVNIQKYITGDTGLNFNLRLSHEAELSPMLMELFIDKIEVFTWDGEYEH